MEESIREICEDILVIVEDAPISNIGASIIEEHIEHILSILDRNGDDGK